MDLIQELQLLNKQAAELLQKYQQLSEFLQNTDNYAKKDLSNITSLGKILELDGTGSGLDADFLRGLEPSQISAPNKIVVTNSSGKIDPSFFDSNLFSLLQLFQSATFDIVPLNFQLNEIYQADHNMLCLYMYQDFRIKIGRNSPPDDLDLNNEHNQSTVEGGFGIFIIPKGWYWEVISAVNCTHSNSNGLYEIFINGGN